ncbi:DnaJ-like protein [Aureococcus anophagefferens]|uniref:DnaJ-like protein n=1 Tax=Aureococcus anophagefferens TaxID=44056 RepID=A0ABR1GCI6_AURAN
MLLRLLLVAGAALTAHADDARAILGVPRGASTAEIKAAYRKAALKYHPDKGGDQDMFVKVAQAFEGAGDPARAAALRRRRRPRARAARRRYDALPRARDGGRSTYSKVTRTGPDGRSSSSVSISLDGSLGEAFAAAVVPDWLARLPGAGALVVLAATWTPSLLCLSFCWRCCLKPKSHAA